MYRLIILIFMAVMVAGFSLTFAMPPHPEALERIRNGEVPLPVFMEDPSYFVKTGINQPHNDFNFSPDMPKANWKTLAVCVSFSDLGGSVFAHYFDTLLFAQTYHTGPSLRQFYNRASYGNLDIIAVDLPSSLAWQTLPNNRFYYTAAGGTYTYGMGAYPNNSQKLCEDLLAIIDPLVNFANYDNNSDGYVDGIVIVHAGREAAISLDIQDIWSHRWAITPQVRDGVYVMNYCVDSEYRYAAGDQTVGTFAHEFGHILGLPDLYDYTVPFDAYGLGYWSLMAYGGWNGDLGAPDTLAGSSPAFLDAYSRVKLGFVTPANINCYVPLVHVPPVADSATVYKLWSYGNYTGNEYFLVENRYQLFTDTALAAWGLLIYHVDENQTNNNNQWWPGQPPANHYMVALEQADNSYHLEHGNNGMDYTDVFWQNYNQNFGPATSPSSNDYYGNNTHVSITNISQGYTVTADLDVGATAIPDVPILATPEDSSYYCLDLAGASWYAVLCASKYHGQLDNDPDFSSPLYSDSTLLYNYFAYSLHYQPDGWYHVRARAGNAAGWSGWTERRSFLVDRVAPSGSVASSPDTAYSSSFLVTWSTGTDPAPSSGLCKYRVYADTGAGPWMVWMLDVDSLSAIFTDADSGKTYYFQARAIDCALNVEIENLIPECSTYVTYANVGFEYLLGDANMANGTWPPAVIGSDVTYLVNYFRGMITNPACMLDGNFMAADVNASCNVIGSDVTRLVSYFRGQASIDYCPDWEPVWHNSSELPGEAPSGWPNCE